MTKHQFYEPKDIGPDDDWGQRIIVDGGLSVCKVCNGWEGSLTTDCPSATLSFDTINDIYNGKIDFKEGKGWVKELNPTNIIWLYSSYIRYYKSDFQFCKENKLEYDYFREIKQEWANKGYNLNKIEKR